MDTGTIVLPWKQPHADRTSVLCDGTPLTSVAHLRAILIAVSTANGLEATHVTHVKHVHTLRRSQHTRLLQRRCSWEEPHRSRNIV